MTRRSIVQLYCRLDELFDDEQLEKVLVDARRRIVATFDHATEFHRGRIRGTDNYIVGVAARQRELAQYIVQNARSFIDASQLPSWIPTEPRKVLKYVIERAEYDAVLAMLNEMCGPGVHDIWFDEGYGIWQIRAGVVDEYRADVRTVRQATMKFDRRNEHGQVRSQRKARRRLTGASISDARYLPAM